PGLRGRGDHFKPQVESPRANRDKIRLLLLQHLAVVGVGAFGMATLDGFPSSGFVNVGDSRHLDEVEFVEGSVPLVAIVADAGVPDKRRAVQFARLRPGQGKRSERGSK